MCFKEGGHWEGEVRKRERGWVLPRSGPFTNICFHFDWNGIQGRVLFRCSIYLLASVFTFPVNNKEKGRFACFPCSIMLCFKCFIRQVKTCHISLVNSTFTNYYLELFLIKMFCVLNPFGLRIIYNYSSFFRLLFSQCSFFWSKK